MSYANIVVRRGPIFPFRNRQYWDLTPYNAGYVPVTDSPGAIVINNNGLMLNIKTGKIYHDPRFDNSIM
jgi:hypothetical protein